VKLVEFSIRRYGPLPDIGAVPLSDFTLICGANEDGKTLALEAVVRMLTGKGARLFPGIDRVDENPSGYVILRDDEGEEHKLPDAGDLSSLCDLQPSHCRNILVVRDSDLAVPNAFYSDLADQLTGLRTDDIQAICKALRALGALTPTLRMSDSEEHDKTASRLQEAEELIGRIDELAPRVEEEGLADAEAQLARGAERLEVVETQLTALETARKQARFETVSGTLKQVHELKKTLAEYQKFTDADLQRWIENAARVDRAAADTVRLEEALKKFEGRVEDAERAMKVRRSRLGVIERRRAEVDAIRAELRNCQANADIMETASKQVFAYKLGAFLTAAVAVASIVGFVFTGNSAMWMLALPMALACLFFVYQAVGQLRVARIAAEQLASVKRVAAQAGLTGDTVEIIAAAVRDLDDEFQSMQQQVSDLETDLRVARQRMQEVKGDQMPRVQQTDEAARAEVERIRSNARLDTPEQYRAAVEKKRQIEAGLAAQYAVLSNELGHPEGHPEDNIPFWEEELRKLAAVRDQETDMQFNEDLFARLQGERANLQAEVRRLRSAVSRIGDDLRIIEQRANAVLRTPSDEPLYCSASADLPAVRDRLRQFTASRMERADVARAAIGVFSEIGEHEEAKVARMFGPASPVSRYFAEVTGGLYESVDYVSDGEERTIEVRLRSGTTLDASQLSGGTWDQLYLAVRLALGQSLLGGRKGFFLMDDPFVKADPDRLLRQLDLLKKLVALGWQVIYFTAKAEVTEALAAEVEAGSVRRVRLGGLLR
jgi:exonuclease SbcC